VAIRVYIVPAMGDGLTPATAWRPSYVPAGVRPYFIPYGDELVYLLAVDVTPAEHAVIAAQVPVTVVPQDLSSTVTAQAEPTVQAELDSWGIPGQWVAQGMTYSTVLKGVAAVFQIANRLLSFGARLLPPGITLSTTMAQLTQQQRDRLQAVADSLNLSTAGVVGGTTLRQFLRIVAAQWSRQLRLGSLILGA